MLTAEERWEDALAEAKALVPSNRQVAYFWTLGSIRLAVGDLEDACTAGNEALALDPSDPGGYFLLGSVVDVEGDISSDIELVENTFEPAPENNTQLAAVARVRMGTSLQRPARISTLAEGQPAADEFCSIDAVSDPSAAQSPFTSAAPR